MSNRKRKHGIFAVTSEAVEMIQAEETQQYKPTGKPIAEALETVFMQMKITGNRPRTIESYEYIFKQFVEMNGIEYVEEINIDSIYNYLGKLDVSQRTKLIRLKSTKAVLSKFHNNGWIKERFWSNIQIKIDKEVKKGAKEMDIDRLLQLIDKTTFIGYRDACAVMMMYKTGIRIRTLGELSERHIDFENLCFDRFARSASQGSELVKELIAKGVKVHILNIGLLDNTPASKLIKNIFFAFAEFERDMIVERTQEGKSIAKQNPNYREGRKPTYTKAKLDHAMKLKETHSFSQVEEITGISMSTLKRESKKRKGDKLV